MVMNDEWRNRQSLRTLALIPAMAALTAACTYPRLQVRPLERGPDSGRGAENQRQSDSDRAGARIERLTRARTGDAAPGSSARVATPEITLEEIEALFPNDSRIEANLPAQSLPQFIDTVFAQVLEVPYAVGPGVSDRREVVALRGTARMSKRAFFAMVQSTLRDYGVALAVDRGAVRVFRDEVLSSDSPILLRQRSFPDGLSPSQAVIQFFELQSIDVNSMTSLLNDTYPNANRVRITARQDINTLVVAGNAREVAALAEIVDQIDQPRFAGAQIVRVEPVYWSAPQLVDAVTQILNTEGYQAARGGGGIQRAVTFHPVPYTNQVLLFSNLPEAFERALYWIEQLDRPSALGQEEGVFVYDVQATSAEDLGRLVGLVQAGGGVVGADTSSAQNNASANGNAGAANGANRPAVSVMGRITIDAQGNRILYRGTPSEFARVRDLLVQLDRPARQVLVEMTIAEVTLTDETRFGIEWDLATVMNGNDTWTGGTDGGLGLGGNGLVLNYSHPDVRAALNAFASNNNINILSTPRLVARSGGEAEIQVGTDVPVITSQQAATTQIGGNTDILQTVQYRRTGVILNIRPIVLGDDRIDIEITQEVSSAQNNPNQAIGSPVILNRNVSTQLSLRPGATAVIGGLIQDTYSRGNLGVPVLKDIPLIGQAFRTDSADSDRTELLILITPYVVDSDDLGQATENYLRPFNRLLARRGPHAYTLLPWAPPIRPTRSYGGRDAVAPPRGFDFGLPFLRHDDEEEEQTQPAPAPAPAPLPAPETPPAADPQAAPTASETQSPVDLTPAAPASTTERRLPSNVSEAAIEALRRIAEAPDASEEEAASAMAAIAELQAFR